MSKIQLTAGWAVEITACNNLETMGIDQNDPGIMHEANSQLSKVISELLPDSPGNVEFNANFRDWNGGKLDHDGYSSNRIHCYYYSRELRTEEDIMNSLGGYSEQAEFEQVYSDNWEWVGIEDIPAVIRLGVESICDKAADARDKVINNYLASQDQSEFEAGVDLDVE